VRESTHTHTCINSYTRTHTQVFEEQAITKMDAELSEFKRKLSRDYTEEQDITVSHHERDAALPSSSPQANLESSAQRASLAHHGDVDMGDRHSVSGSEFDHTRDQRRHRGSHSSEEGDGIKVCGIVMLFKHGYLCSVCVFYACVYALISVDLYVQFVYCMHVCTP
jgi:hypothetical protein